MEKPTKKTTKKQKNYWQLPQGGIDKGEETTAAAKREAFEETGIKNLDLIKISDKTNIYYWNNALRKLFKNRNHKNCGQKQTIVYLKFLGSDTEIQMDQKEFIGFKWASIQELNSLVHPERETLAKIVQNDLKEMLEKAII
jgi:putative (di)nucleoside polyphosphate hydrolase